MTEQEPPQIYSFLKGDSQELLTDLYSLEMNLRRQLEQVREMIAKQTGNPYYSEQPLPLDPQRRKVLTPFELVRQRMDEKREYGMDLAPETIPSINGYFDPDDAA